MIKGKKSSKQTVEKSQASPQVMDVKGMVKSHGSFLGLLVLFAGFSLYAVVSFSGSTNNYIKGMYASVLGAEGAQVVQESVGYEIFSDVMSEDLHATAIEKLKDLGIFGGYSDGTFRPDKLINRAQILAVLETVIDVDFAGASYGECFTDVKNEWFAVPVCYAKKQGWIAGMDDGSFKPNDGVGYPEALKTITAIFGFEVAEKVEVDPIAGVKTTAWYAPYYKTAVDYGLIDANYVFDAKHQLTRAEFAELVYQAMKAKKMF